MSDDKHFVGKQDDIRINLHQPHEVTYWKAEFGVTREELEKAVKAAGPIAMHVRKYFQKKGVSSRTEWQDQSSAHYVY